MKKTVLIICVLYNSIGFSQNNKSIHEDRYNNLRDSIYYFPVWEVKNEKLFSVFDKIIERNKKCIKNKKWDGVGNDYFFNLGIFNYPTNNDSCNTFKIDITAYAGTELIETYLMSYFDMSFGGPYSGVIIYKNEIFMIWNNPKVNDIIPFITKTQNMKGVLIRNKSYIKLDKDKSVSAYKFEFEYLYKNGSFKLIKKECCP